MVEAATPRVEVGTVAVVATEAAVGMAEVPATAEVAATAVAAMAAVATAAVEATEAATPCHRQEVPTALLSQLAHPPLATLHLELERHQC